MRKNLKCIIFFIISLSLVQTVRSQNNIDSTFPWFFQNVSAYHGNVFLDTTYKKTDTARLRKIYGQQLSEELKLINIYQMRLTDFSLKNLSPVLYNIRSIGDFYKEKNRSLMISVKDSVTLDKFDSLVNRATSLISNKKSYDSSRRIESRLFKSSYYELFSKEREKSRPKLMTVLGIFESDRMYLIVYHFMILFGYQHYYVKSELILK